MLLGDSATNAHPYVGIVATVDIAAAIVLCLIALMTVAEARTDSDLAGKRIIAVELVGELLRQRAVLPEHGGVYRLST